MSQTVFTLSPLKEIVIHLSRPITSGAFAPQDFIDGGTPSTTLSNFIDGGTPSSTVTDLIDGGTP